MGCGKGSKVLSRPTTIANGRCTGSAVAEEQRRNRRSHRKPIRRADIQRGSDVWATEAERPEVLDGVSPSRSARYVHAQSSSLGGTGLAGCLRLPSRCRAIGGGNPEGHLLKEIPARTRDFVGASLSLETVVSILTPMLCSTVSNVCWPWNRYGTFFPLSTSHGNEDSLPVSIGSGSPERSYWHILYLAVYIIITIVRMRSLRARMDGRRNGRSRGQNPARSAAVCCTSLEFTPSILPAAVLLHVGRSLDALRDRILLLAVRVLPFVSSVVCTDLPSGLEKDWQQPGGAGGHRPVRSDV